MRTTLGDPTWRCLPLTPHQGPGSQWGQEKKILVNKRLGTPIFVWLAKNLRAQEEAEGSVWMNSKVKGKRITGQKRYRRDSLALAPGTCKGSAPRQLVSAAVWRLSSTHGNNSIWQYYPHVTPHPSYQGNSALYISMRSSIKKNVPTQKAHLTVTQRAQCSWAISYMVQQKVSSTRLRSIWSKEN